MMQYEFIDPEDKLASTDFTIVESFLHQTNRSQVGWHYVMDLVWIYQKIQSWPKSFTILDAGGGLGPVQFLLAEMGFYITNIDLISRIPPVAYQKRYHCKARKLPSYTETDYKSFIQPKKKNVFLRYLRKTPVFSLVSQMKKPPFIYDRLCKQWRHTNTFETPVGRINWITGNLCSMPEIPTDHFDAVVSLSALEHIPYGQLPDALAELKRVLKPGGKWAVTTSGTEKADSWFHEPSQGWCFSENDLENIFKGKSVNDIRPETVLAKYQHCKYLQENLAEFYKKSGKFGMPWGKWDPKYIPVGISKT